jgi:hypothetical protein
LIKVAGIHQQVITKAEEKYRELAKYKVAKSTVIRGELILCDLVAIFVTAMALHVGTLGDQKSISRAATSILLLQNLSGVLKFILQTFIDG